MPKIHFCGKGGSGKSTLLALLALYLSKTRDVLVVDAVGGRGQGRIVLRTAIGGSREVDLPVGELVPRAR